MNSLVQTTMKNLEQHRFTVSFVETRAEALALAQELLHGASTVGYGGSATIEEIGLLEWLKTSNKQVLHRRDPALTSQEQDDVMRATSYADAFLMSTNAVIASGALYNIDGNANRIAALSFGPKKVYVFAGVNKIVENDAAAVTRVRTVAAPRNAIRLNRSTPCVKTGYCTDCLRPERICAVEAFHRFSYTPGRIHIILINEILGY